MRYQLTIATLVGGRPLLHLVPSYIAFLISPSSILAIPLGPAVRIDRIVANWRQEVSGHSLLAGVSMRSAEHLCQVAGRTVRQQVWDPISTHLDGASRVFIVPDGVLNVVNFSALPVGEHDYLAEHGPVIHLLSTERDLVAADRSGLGRGLLAVGDPAYGALASSSQGGAARGVDCASPQALHFDSLPAARAEVHDIEDLGLRTQRKWHRSWWHDAARGKRSQQGRRHRRITRKTRASPCDARLFPGEWL